MFHPRLAQEKCSTTRPTIMVRILGCVGVFGDNGARSRPPDLPDLGTGFKTSACSGGVVDWFAVPARAVADVPLVRKSDLRVRTALSGGSRPQRARVLASPAAGEIGGPHGDPHRTDRGLRAGVSDRAGTRWARSPAASSRRPSPTPAVSAWSAAATVTRTGCMRELALVQAATDRPWGVGLITWHATLEVVELALRYHPAAVPPLVRRCPPLVRRPSRRPAAP